MHNVFKNKLGAAVPTIDLGVVQIKLFRRTEIFYFRVLFEPFSFRNGSKDIYMGDWFVA